VGDVFKLPKKEGRKNTLGTKAIQQQSPSSPFGRTGPESGWEKNLKKERSPEPGEVVVKEVPGLVGSGWGEKESELFQKLGGNMLRGTPLGRGQGRMRKKKSAYQTNGE